jgi:hypothetical protein
MFDHGFCVAMSEFNKRISSAGGHEWLRLVNQRQWNYLGSYQRPNGESRLWGIVRGGVHIKSRYHERHLLQRLFDRCIGG